MFYLYRPNYPKLVDEEVLSSVKNNNSIGEYSIYKIKAFYSDYESGILKIMIDDEMSDIERYLSFMPLPFSIITVIYTMLVTSVTEIASTNKNCYSILFTLMFGLLGLFACLFLIIRYYKRANIYYRYFKIIKEVLFQENQ